jgi:hypothetical protein
VVVVAELLERQVASSVLGREGLPESKEQLLERLLTELQSL